MDFSKRENPNSRNTIALALQNTISIHQKLTFWRPKYINIVKDTQLTLMDSAYTDGLNSNTATTSGHTTLHNR